MDAWSGVVVDNKVTLIIVMRVGTETSGGECYPILPPGPGDSSTVFALTCLFFVHFCCNNLNDILRIYSFVRSACQNQLGSAPKEPDGHSSIH